MASSSSCPNNVREGTYSRIGPQYTRTESSVSPRLFDVFINHRGPDVKATLALHLYNSLQSEGFRAFLDCKEIGLGDLFPSTIESAISSSLVHIAIFSKGYVQSYWCLHELTLMLKSRAKIIPVFYDVIPSDLRCIGKAKGVYADVFAEYEYDGKHIRTLEKWKESLNSVSFIRGYELNKHNNNIEELCKKIVSAVAKEIEKTKSLNVAKHPVGLDDIVEDFERHCTQKREEKENIIGIFGMGGSGKTTLAIEIFNRKRLEYHGSCFLFDVREASNKSELPYLQAKLLRDLVQEKYQTFQSIEEGTNALTLNLRRGDSFCFLIVLDDIDHMDQLNALLVADVLNSNSLVIVTTRDERVLIKAGISQRYKMKEMNIDHSKQLFCWHAFSQSCPSSGYEHLVDSFVKACAGSPLSLKVLGGHLFGSTDKQYWQLQLQKVCTTLDKDVKYRLKISYDALDSDQQQIFMDIACFFIGEEQSMAIRIWDASGWSALQAIQTLKDKCLVEIVEGDMLPPFQVWKGDDYHPNVVFRMHDHLRDLGRDLGREMLEKQGPDQLNPPLRLWHPNHLRSLESMGFQNILTASKGRSLRCFHTFLDPSMGFNISYFLGNSNDCLDASTVLLWLFLEPISGEHTSIPPWIPMQNLQCLTSVKGVFSKLGLNNAQIPFQLKELVVDLGEFTVSLNQFLKSLEKSNQLEDLVLHGNTLNFPLIEVGSLSLSLGKFTSLRRLILSQFRTSSRELSFNNNDKSSTLKSRTSSLGKIVIRQGKHVSKISICGDYYPELKSLHILEMPSLTEVDLTQLTSLVCLELKYCYDLEELSCLSHLSCLEKITIDGCWELEELSFANLSRLENITISGCWMLRNITDYEGLDQLKYLQLSAIYNGGVILNCIQRFQRLPSECTIISGHAVEGAESILNTNFFFDQIDADTVNEIDRNELGVFEMSLNMAYSLGAIIVCSVVHTHVGGQIAITFYPAKSIVTTIGTGTSIIAVVITDQNELCHAPHYLTQSYWMPDMTFHSSKFGAPEIKKQCILSVKKGSEGKTLLLLNRIGLLYK